MKKILALLVALALFVVSCGKGEKLKVGATPVPHGEFLKLVKDDLKKQGVDLEIVEFNDYILPNKALADKSIDANFFQHVPYMEDFGKKNHIDMVAVGNIHLEPMALYSKKIKNIKENLFWAFIYNIIGIPVAMGVLHLFGGPLLNPMIGGAAMSFSSVSVVLNALRLKRAGIK